VSPSVSIGKPCFQEILALLKEDQQIEIVGLGFGIWDTRNHGTISDFEPMLNVDNSPSRFSIDYEVFYQHILKYEKEGKELVGIFHSHPGHAQVAPSLQDIRFMRYWPFPYVWLIGRAGSDPEVKAFALKDGKAIELVIKLF
jgi:proteasome lid subunit RPN8/RPN11